MTRTKLRGTAAALACIGLATTLAGCGSASDSASGGSGKTITVAAEYGGLKFPYHSALKQGLAAKAAQLGGIKMIDGDSNGDTGTELTNVQNLITRQPDCLLLIPVSNASSAPAEAASAANIPVISFDQKAAGPTKAFVGYDQLQSGDLLGQFVVDQYDAIGKSKIKVIYLRGLIGQAADTARNQGVKATLTKAGLGSDKVEIYEQAADYDRAKAESITTALLRQHPDVDVIIANNDDMVLGAYAATQSLGLKTGPSGTLHMSGIDGVPESLQLISDGKIDATMFQNPVDEANAALPVCVAAAKGEAVKDTILPFKQVKQADAAAALAAVQPVY